MKGEEDRVEWVKHEMGDWHKAPECVSACETDGGWAEEVNSSSNMSLTFGFTVYFIYLFFLFWSSTGSSLGSEDRQTDTYTECPLLSI